MAPPGGLLLLSLSPPPPHPYRQEQQLPGWSSPLISKCSEAAGQQEARLTPFPTQCSPARLCAAAGGHVGVGLGGRQVGSLLSLPGVSQPLWLWPRQKMRVRAGPRQRATRYFGGPEPFYLFSWRMKTVKIWCSGGFRSPLT